MGVMGRDGGSDRNGLYYEHLLFLFICFCCFVKITAGYLKHLVILLRRTQPKKCVFVYCMYCESSFSMEIIYIYIYRKTNCSPRWLITNYPKG